MLEDAHEEKPSSSNVSQSAAVAAIAVADLEEEVGDLRYRLDRQERKLDEILRELRAQRK